MLVDAAVHTSGASQKLISPFIPASAAKPEKYEIRAVDKKYKRKETKQKNSSEDRVHREAILFSEN